MIQTVFLSYREWFKRREEKAVFIREQWLISYSKILQNLLQHSSHYRLVLLYWLGIFSWHTSDPAATAADQNTVSVRKHPFIAAGQPFPDGYFLQDTASHHKAQMIFYWFLEQNMYRVRTADISAKTV